MSNNERREINELEKTLNLLIEEINKKKKYYENEINNLKNNKYSEEIRKIQDNINKIKSQSENHIKKNINEKLLPEYFYKVDFLESRIKFYEDVIKDILDNQNNYQKKLNDKIEECKNDIKEINKINEKIKNAIWNKGMINLKIDEAFNIRELKDYKMKIDHIMNK